MISSLRGLLWGPETILAIQRFFGRDWLWLFDKISMLGDIQVVVLVFALVFWNSGSRTAYGLANFLLSHALDVLAGAALGSIALLVYLGLWPYLAGWFSRRSFRFYLLAGVAVVAGSLAAFPLLAGVVKGWQLVGLSVGAGISFPVHRRYTRHCPRNWPRGRRAWHALIGLAGALAILIPAPSLGDTRPRVGAALYAFSSCG